MALNKVEICGVNTARLPLLKNEEKEALFERIKEGDSEARELYIKGNLRLVLSVIRRFGSSSENADDLFQIGCIGLMKAIDNFDSTLNVKFSTYAVPMIIGEIRRYLRRQQFHTGESVTSGYGLQGHLRPGRLCEKESQGAHDHGDRGGDRYSERGDCLRHGRNSDAHEPLRPGYTRRAATRSMSWTRSATKRTGKKTGSKCFFKRGGKKADGPGTADHPAAFLRGKDPDGGGASYPDLPGPGEPARKKCLKTLRNYLR